MSLEQFLAGQPVPKPVEGPPPRPVNELSDEELLAALPRDVVFGLSEEWGVALARSRVTLEGAGGPLSPRETLEYRVAVQWNALNAKLRALASLPVVHANPWMEVVRSQLHMRLRDLRSRGILPGDPREDKLLEQHYPPPGESPRG
jgi:hypothetical protein